MKILSLITCFLELQQCQPSTWRFADMASCHEMEVHYNKSQTHSNVVSLCVAWNPMTLQWDLTDPIQRLALIRVKTK